MLEKMQRLAYSYRGKMEEEKMAAVRAACAGDDSRRARHRDLADAYRDIALDLDLLIADLKIAKAKIDNLL